MGSMVFPNCEQIGHNSVVTSQSLCLEEKSLLLLLQVSGKEEHWDICNSDKFLVLHISLFSWLAELILKLLILVYTYRAFSCLFTWLFHSHFLHKGRLQAVVNLYPINSCRYDGVQLHFYHLPRVPICAWCSLLLLSLCAGSSLEQQCELLLLPCPLAFWDMLVASSETLCVVLSVVWETSEKQNCGGGASLPESRNTVTQWFSCQWRR